MSVVIYGAGAFGSALAIALAQGGQTVTLVARDATAAAAIRDAGRSPRLPDTPLPDGITVTHDIQAVTTASTVLLTVPAQALTGAVASLPETATPLVACCKGIDLATGRGPSDVIRAARPAACVAVLTGPSFARDIAAGLPTALTLACADPEAARALQATLSTRSLRLYTTDDLRGAELGGALKNVIAIACGVTIGAGLGDSARAAVMTRGFAEMTRFALARGGRAETLSGLSGLGDLALTCTSELSRNYRFGLALGQGRPPAAGETVEGAATARAVAALPEAPDMPLCQTVARLIDTDLTVAGALDALLSRPLKKETA